MLVEKIPDLTSEICINLLLTGEGLPTDMVHVSQELKSYDSKNQKEEPLENFTQIFGKKHQIANLNEKITNKEFYSNFEIRQHENEIEQSKISNLNLPPARLQEHKDREQKKRVNEFQSSSSSSKSKLHLVEFDQKLHAGPLNQKGMNFDDEQEYNDEYDDTYDLEGPAVVKEIDEDDGGRELVLDDEHEGQSSGSSRNNNNNNDREAPQQRYKQTRQVYSNRSNRDGPKPEGSYKPRQQRNGNPDSEVRGTTGRNFDSKNHQFRKDREKQRRRKAGDAKMQNMM